MKNLLTVVFCFIICISAFSQETENFVFQSDGLTLVGTHHVPEGEGPFPSLIIVHGSGPTNRNGSLQLNGALNICLYPEIVGETISPYSEIAEYLSANGIFVMTYDKRTLTHGAFLNPITASPYDFATDVESAIDFLKLREDIDQDCIVLAGHSQGAGLIPFIAEERNDVAGLISLAGATQAIDTILARQNLEAYRDCFNQEAQGQQIYQDMLSLFGELRAGNIPDDQTLELIFPGQTQPSNLGYPTFWTDWIEISEGVIENYASANKATLILHGDDDFNVDVQDSYDLSAALDPNRTQTKIFEGINHFFTTSTDPRVDEEVLVSIRDWILNVKRTVGTQQVLNENAGIKIIDQAGSIRIKIQTDEFEDLHIYQLTGNLLKTINIKDISEVVINDLDQNHGMLIFNFQGSEKIYTEKFMTF